jgi:Mn-containing catalase
MTREVAHQKSFEKALYAIEDNFPPGKLRGNPRFADTYFDMSQGEGDRTGPWNAGENWEVVREREKQAAVDGGDGRATINLPKDEADALLTLAARTKSRDAVDPITGAELGAGPGAGRTSLDT